MVIKEREFSYTDNKQKINIKAQVKKVELLKDKNMLNNKNIHIKEKDFILKD